MIMRSRSRMRIGSPRIIPLLSLLVLMFFFFSDETRINQEHGEKYFVGDEGTTLRSVGLMLDPVPDSQSRSQWAVPRGQSFYYDSLESLRLGSFETWRPREKVGENARRRNNEDDNVHIVMLASSDTLWKHVPIQILAMFEQFKKFAIYSDSADSIGGVEVVDPFHATNRELQELSTDSPANRMLLDQRLLDTLEGFEPYRILQAIRENHAGVSADEILIPRIAEFKRFLVLPAMYQAFQAHPESDWFVVVDERTMLFDENLRRILSKLDPSTPYYLGSAVKGPEHVFASLEAGIVLSREAMRSAFEMPIQEAKQLIYSNYMRKAESECCGDYMLAAYLNNRLGLELDMNASQSLFQGESIANVKACAWNWCSPIVSLGRQRPRDIELVTDYLDLKKEGPVLYSDIYLDFIKPYIPSNVAENWDNGAKDIEFNPGSDSHAYRSLVECRRACNEIEQCLMLRYDQYTQYCGLGISSVALGRPVLQYAAELNPRKCQKFGIQCKTRNRDEIMSSEWFINRIRSMRQSLECDTLHSDPQSEGIEFGALDQVEGWWRRFKEGA